MAKQYTPEEYYRITFGNVGTPSNGNILRQSDALQSKIIKAMEAGAEHAILFSENMKKIDEQSYTWYNQALVHKDDFRTAMASAHAMSGYINTKQKLVVNPKLNTEEMVMLDFQRKRMGALSKSIAKEEIERLGGTFQKTSTDMVNLGFPVTKADWNAEVAKFGGDTVKAKNSFSKLLDRELKASAGYSKDLSRREREKEKEKEEKERQKQEEKEKKESQANSKAMLFKFARVIAVLITVANICRRILTASLKRGAEIKQQAIDSRSVGMSYMQSKMYESQERVMGLKPGTFMGAIGNLQNSFGDITQLDTKAIESLARVMGGSVRQLIESGIGGKDPEKLMKLILDAYYKRAQQGYNSIGQYVGKADAERELATALEHAGMGELANILRNMFYVGNTGIYKGMIGLESPTEDYLTLTQHDNYGMQPIDITVAEETTQVVEQLKDSFALLKDAIQIDLLLALKDAINKINNFRIGKTAEENNQMDIRNRELNRKGAEKLSKFVAESEEQTGAYFGSALFSAGFESMDDWYDFLSSKKQGMAQYAKNIEAFRTESKYEGLRRLMQTSQGSLLLSNYEAMRTARENVEKGMQLANDYSGEHIGYNEDDYSIDSIIRDTSNNFNKLLMSMEKSGIYGSSVNLGYGTNTKVLLPYGVFAEDFMSTYEKEYNAGKRLTFEDMREGKDLVSSLYTALGTILGKEFKTYKKKGESMADTIARALTDGIITEDFVREMAGTLGLSATPRKIGLSADAVKRTRELAMNRAKTSMQDFNIGASLISNINPSVISSYESKLKPGSVYSAEFGKYNESKRTIDLTFHGKDKNGKDVTETITLKDVEKSFNSLDKEHYEFATIVQGD